MDIVRLNEAPYTTVHPDKGQKGYELGLKDRQAGYSSTPATIQLNRATLPSTDIRHLFDLHS